MTDSALVNFKDMTFIFTEQLVAIPGICDMIEVCFKVMDGNQNIIYKSIEK